MRTFGSALVVLVLLAGCGGGANEASLSAEGTAHEWVDAVNADDYDRACDLSLFEKKSDCLDLMQERPFGDDLEVRLFTDDPPSGDPGAFIVSSAQERKPGGPPVVREAFSVERHGDQYKVHFEFSLIK